jgi:taurine dioxygenase
VTLSIMPISGTLGAIVTGVALDVTLDETTATALRKAFDEHSVLCIRGQRLQPAQLLAVARVFGTPRKHINEHQQFPGFPQIGVLSSDSIDVHGTRKRVIDGTTWHTDHSFTARPPAATLLYAIEIPDSGGNTSFCNMRAAYEALPQTTRTRIAPLRAIHTYESTRTTRKMMARTEHEIAETPDVTHPLVRTHPPTGSKALYMSTTRLERIVGLEQHESEALIDELIAHATQSQFLGDHIWEVGDVLIWDNRCTMHHANADYPLDARRCMHRILIEDAVPVVA